MAMAMEVAVEDSPKKVARQRRWAVCAAKVRSGAFSSLGGDSDSESDDGVGFDGSRFKLKACMSFSGNTNLPQPEEGDDLTTQSSYTSTEGLSVDCATPVDGATTRPSPASPDLIGISLSLGQKEESPWELSSSSGESVHSTTRSQTSVQSRAVPARCERGVCPESPGSYVTRMQRTLLRIERNGASSNSHASSNNTTATNSNVNRAVGSNINGTVNGTAANSSSVDGSAINTGQDCVGTDCVGTGPAVGVLAAGGVAAGRSDVHDAESMNGSSSLPDRERQEEDKHHQEMDLMIAAIATMVGMHIPEEARYVLWLVCCAIIVLIPGRRWGLFDPTLWSSPAPSQEEEDFVEPGEEVVEDSAAGEGGGGNARVVGEASHLREMSGDAAVEGDGVGGEDAVTGTAVEEQDGFNSRHFHEVLAGLSDVQVKFMNSAGPDERDRLLLQCLEYANGDMAQATKVCSTFCNFRLSQGWGLVLSPGELEGPLRSRVHTLTEQTDRMGRAILTFSPGKLDMRKASPEAYHKMLCYVLQEILKKQDFQKKGIVLLVDARGVGFGLLRHFVLADYKRGLGMLSGAFPAKLKAIRILHPNRALALALSIALPLLSAKMRARVEIVAGERALDGSFSRNLADCSALPMELSIGGTWTGSQFFWERWVAERLARSK